MRQYLKSVDPDLAALPVMAKAFASGEGLAHLMSKVGIVKPKEAQQFLLRFTCGFSQADDMFDFVLVGKGKDRADDKVMGWFSSEVLCILFPSLITILSFRVLSGSLLRARVASIFSWRAVTTTDMFGCSRDMCTTL